MSDKHKASRETLEYMRSVLDSPEACPCETCVMMRNRIAKPAIDCLLDIAQTDVDLRLVAVKLTAFLGSMVGALSGKAGEDDPHILVNRVLALSEEFTKSAFRAAGFGVELHRLDDMPHANVTKH